MRLKLRGLSAFVLALIIGLPGVVTAEVRVSGNVEGLWTLEDHPYLVVGDLGILQGDTLIIEPGVTVNFGAYYDFDIRGTLIAVGEGEDSVRFIANNFRPDEWNSLKFIGGGSNGSLLNRIVIRYAYRGVELEDANIRIYNSEISYCDDAAVRMVSSVGTVSGCNIFEIGSNGVAVTDQSSGEVRDSDISDCGRYGIAVNDDSRATIELVSITGAGSHGIYLTGAGACQIKWTLISECVGRGISIEQSNNCAVERTIVYRSGGPGLYVYRSQNANLVNNTVYEADGPGIHYFSSSGSIASCLVAFSAGNGIYVQQSEPFEDYNDVYGSGGDDYNGLDAGMNDINEHPQLVNPGMGDFHPRENSPLVDQGRFGDRDPDGTRVDIGAWFFNQNHPPVITNYTPQDPDSLEGDIEITFTAAANDEDDDDLTYYWIIDNEITDSEAGDIASLTHTFEEDGEYRVEVVFDDGLYEGTTRHVWQFSIYGSAITFDEIETPERFELLPAYPNPFNAATFIPVRVQVASRVSVFVYDLNGRRMSGLVDRALQPGLYTFPFDAGTLSNGTYYVRATSAGRTSQQRIVLLK